MGWNDGVGVLVYGAAIAEHRFRSFDFAQDDSRGARDDSGGDGEWRRDDVLGFRAPLGSGSGSGKTVKCGYRPRVGVWGTILRRCDGGGVLNAQLFGKFT